MSRVHDALRRAELEAQEQRPTGGENLIPEAPAPPAAIASPNSSGPRGATWGDAGDWSNLLNEVEEIPFNPAPESHIIDLEHGSGSPNEEFRILRTRLNHLQGLQAIRSLIVTSASPGEGKTFTSANFAMAQAQLADTPVLLADMDLRRPMVHHMFQVNRSPGVSDYITGKLPLNKVIKKLSGRNLYLLPAGTSVKNPLELLNLPSARALFEKLPAVFKWSIFDTPPLLFSADANLMATMADGTLLVVRIGATTYDTVTRAMQSLCENNVIGIVANGAHAGELYSKYTYYYSKQD